METLKILLYSPFYFPVMGGNEHELKSIAVHLARMGHEVHIFTANRGHDGHLLPAPRYEECNGVHVYRYRSLVNLNYASLYPQSLRKLLEIKPDIIHCYVYRHPHTVVALAAKRLLHERTPIILSSRGPFHPREVVGSLVHVIYTIHDTIYGPVLLRSLDCIIALTELDRYELLKCGALLSKVVVIPGAIEDMFFRATPKPPPEDPIILYMGRIYQQKRLDVLVEAMSLIATEVKDAKLVLAGPDEGTLHQIMGLSDKFDVKRNIVYIGTVRGNRRIRVIQNSRIYALPSPYESFGRSSIEAQALGRPAVVTYGGGQRHAVLNGRTGLLARPNDPESLAENILTLLKDKKLYEEMSREARKWARRFTLDKTIGSTLEIYHSLLHNRIKH